MQVGCGGLHVSVPPPPIRRRRQPPRPATPLAAAQAHSPRPLVFQRVVVSFSRAPARFHRRHRAAVCVRQWPNAPMADGKSMPKPTRSAHTGCAGGSSPASPHRTHCSPHSIVGPSDPRESARRCGGRVGGRWWRCGAPNLLVLLLLSLLCRGEVVWLSRAVCGGHSELMCRRNYGGVGGRGEAGRRAGPRWRVSAPCAAPPPARFFPPACKGAARVQ